MKLNNKGFAISTVMYMILIMAIVLITLTLSLLSSRKLVLDKIKQETLNDIYIPESVSFAEDSWETIALNVKDGNLSKYKVGDTKKVTLTGDVAGTYTVRIANISTPEECATEGFSQTACGFVIEFEDIIITHQMNSTATNVGGYPVSEMYKFINEEKDDTITSIYESLPNDLKSVIKNTKVVSSHGNTSGETNFISTDKLYLLSIKEILGSNPGEFDTSANQTRQLDYYKNYKNDDGSIGVTTSSSTGAIKKYNGSAYYWWTRSAFDRGSSVFLNVTNSGGCGSTTADNAYGVSVALRIG